VCETEYAQRLVAWKKKNYEIACQAMAIFTNIDNIDAQFAALTPLRAQLAVLLR
jgi:hypothetical protein